MDGFVGDLRKVCDNDDMNQVKEMTIDNETCSEQSRGEVVLKVTSEENVCAEKFLLFGVSYGLCVARFKQKSRISMEMT